MKSSEWKTIYFIAAGFFFVGNLVFVIFGTAVIQPWNGTTDKKSDEGENNTMPGKQKFKLNKHVINALD